LAPWFRLGAVHHAAISGRPGPDRPIAGLSRKRIQRRALVRIVVLRPISVVKMSPLVSMPIDSRVIELWDALDLTLEHTA
jgi:hypothetical protein